MRVLNSRNTSMGNTLTSTPAMLLLPIRETYVHAPGDKHAAPEYIIPMYAHHRALPPRNRSSSNESKGRDAVDDPAEHNFERVHRVHVGHADGREHGQVHDPNAAAKISTVDGHEQLEDAGASDGGVARVVGDSSGDAPGKMLAKGEEQRGSQQQPREHAQKSIRRRLDEKQRAQ